MSAPFKVGDRVKLASNTGLEHAVGATATVADISPTYVAVLWDGESVPDTGFFHKRFNLIVTPPQPKPGDRIRVTYEAEVKRFFGDTADYAGTVRADGGHYFVPKSATIVILGPSALEQAVSALPDTPDAIAGLLGRLGVKGEKSSTCHCALSNYFKRELGIKSISSSKKKIELESGETAPTPDAAVQFINGFDNDLYPWLVSA